jgi:hypothetical protein
MLDGFLSKEVDFGSFIAGEMQLIESILLPTGAKYEVVKKVTF